MRKILRIASWNMQAGLFSDVPQKGLLPDSAYLSETIRNSKSHVVCLQEVPFAASDGNPIVSSIAAAAGFEFTLELPLGVGGGSDSGLGLAILSRFPLALTDNVVLPNPGLTVNAPDGGTLHSHDKGFLVAHVEGPYGTLAVACGHLLPFHKFRRSASEVPFSPIGSAVRDLLVRLVEYPTVVCADFNLEDLQDYLGALGVSAYKLLVHVPTRPSGKCHDNILVSQHWSVDSVRVLPTRSDHHFCLADIEAGPINGGATEGAVLPSTTTFMHLSDLHFGSGEMEDDDWRTVIRGAAREGRRSRLGQLLEFLPSVPDFVVVSGDVTIGGQDNGFAQFNTLIDEYTTSGKLPAASRFVVVPGNHDVSPGRPGDSGADRWLPFVNHTEGRYVRPWIRGVDEVLTTRISEIIEQQYCEDARVIGGVQGSLAPESERHPRSLPFMFDRHDKVLIYAFNSASIAQSLTELDPDIDARIARLRKIPGPKGEDIAAVLDAFEKERHVDAARVDPGELDLFMRVMVCLRQKEGSAVEAAFKMAVLHHHLSPIVTLEESRKFDLLLNAGRVKRQLAQNGFHVVLHGHKHWHEAFVDSAISGGGSLIVVSGGTVGGGTSTEKVPGFHWLEIDRARGSVKVRYVMLGKMHDDPSECYSGDAVVFQMPRAGETTGVVRAGQENCQVDLKTLYQDAEAGLLRGFRLKPRQSGKACGGWMHRIDSPSVSVIATAYGLAILDLIDSRHPQFLQNRQSMLETILENRLADGGWSASSQGNVSRPEATAWAIAALSRYGLDDEVAKGLEILSGMFRDGGDPEAWDYVFTLGLALRTMAPLCPSSPVVCKLAATLEECAARDGQGRIKYWGRSSLRTSDRWYNGADPSIAHTAHAMLALMAAHRSTRGSCGAPPSALSEARQWLLDQDTWDNQQETIARLRDGGHYEPLQVNHFTAPWVIMALLESGCSTTEPKVRKAIRLVASSREDGLWNWGAEKRPIWATYDALRALTDCALLEKSFTLCESSQSEW